jgi:hypothetical protein
LKQQDIIDFLTGLSDALIHGFRDIQKQGEHGGLGNEIVEGIEKSKKKLFTIGVSIAIAGIGFFLILWGIASAIDAMFTMRGLGFVLVGIIAVLIGALVSKK